MPEIGPREWSPSSGRKRGGVLINVLGNLGDQNPFDYGGFIVYRVRDTDKTGPHSRWIEAEYWFEPETETSDYEVYRWTIASDVFKDLNWVGAWDDVADCAGIKYDEFMKLGRSPNPLDRAVVYEAVGRYHGFENLDSYTETFTREELEGRWPEFKR